MGKKNNHIYLKFLTVVLCILAMLLCAAPCGATTVGVGDTLDLNSAVPDGYMVVLGTLNLYPGAHVEYFIYALSGEINIYAGELGDDASIWILDGENNGYSNLVVTVYGTGFAVDGVPLDPSVTEFVGPPDGSAVLTGTYENGDPIELEFLFSADVPVHLSNLISAVSEVAIDIKPGGSPNSINLKSKGVVPVAVLTAAGFDAATVDPATVLFADAAPVRWTLEDVDGDGDADMLFDFKTQDLNLDENSTEAMLTGQTTEEVVFQGTDEVRIVPANK